MKLLIAIPKEFESEFLGDRFEDSLHRLSSDAHLMAGFYEKETASMLIKAFQNAVLIFDHGRLVDADALLARMKQTDRYFSILYDVERAPTVIPAEGGD